MTRALIVKRAGPGMTVQDFGRPGYLAYGVSRGGAVDRLALYEGGALLGQEAGTAVIEMAGAGGVFEAREDLRIALTGAPMRANIDGTALRWNASHALPAGSLLTIGAAEQGSFGYLSVGGGIATPEIMGARSAHLAAGIGAPIEAGQELPIGEDAGGPVSRTLTPENRFSGGTVRVLPSLQTELFDASERDRFEETTFTRDPRSNRMGSRMTFEGDGFAAETGLKILSEAIVPGDIQIAGDGTPFVLMAECQTVGGYPRIGSVLPSDLARIAQATPKDRLRFRFITREEAVEAEKRAAAARKGLRKSVTPLIRDPRTIPDLLSYQLISGVTAGD